MASNIKNILNLIRINMSSAIAFSALVGHVSFSHTFSLTLIPLYFGVLLLAFAASSLNQMQEMRMDKLMERTRNRPLPSGQMKLGIAVCLTLLMTLSGIIVLYIFTTPLTTFLGIFNMAWYNGLYTPLKRRTGFVVIIGAVTGMIPPIMGWTAAGGYLLDTGIILIAAFFFLWQIPHFFLLLLRYKDDYRKAGFKTIISDLSENQTKVVVFMWILGTSLITMFFPLFGIIQGAINIALIIVINAILIIVFYRSVFNKNVSFNIGRAFGSLYLYQLSILAILIIQGLIK